MTSQQMPRWWCSLCNIDLTSQVTYESHVVGKKHRKLVWTLMRESPSTNPPEIREKTFAPDPPSASKEMFKIPEDSHSEKIVEIPVSSNENIDPRAKDCALYIEKLLKENDCLNEQQLNECFVVLSVFGKQIFSHNLNLIEALYESVRKMICMRSDSKSTLVHCLKLIALRANNFKLSCDNEEFFKNQTPSYVS